MESVDATTQSASPAVVPEAEAAANSASTPTSGPLFTRRGYWQKCHEGATHQAPPAQPIPPLAAINVETSGAEDAPLHAPSAAREADLIENGAPHDEAAVTAPAIESAPPAEMATAEKAAAAAADVPAAEVVSNGHAAPTTPSPRAASSAASHGTHSSSSSLSSSSSESESSGIPTTGSRFDILMQSNSGAQGGSSAGDRDSYRSVVRKATRACHNPTDRHKEATEAGTHGAESGSTATTTTTAAAAAAAAKTAPVGEPIGITTRPPFKRLQAQPFSHILVCDFEATCEGGSVNYPHEIIEFPVVVIDTATLRAVAEFHAYVRPVKHPKLSRFCTELTGITQATVDASETLPVVIARFQTWLETDVYPLCRAWRLAHDPSPDVSALSTNLRSEQKRFVFDDSTEARKANIPEEKMICFATDGPWDMRCFMHECSVLRDGIEFPPVFYRYINVRHAYCELFKVKQIKLTHMLRRLGMGFEGQRHSGICDTRNIARVLAEVMARGYRVHHVSTIKYAHRGDSFLEHNQLARELLEEEEREKQTKQNKQKHKDPASQSGNKPSSSGGNGNGGTAQHAKGVPRNTRRRGKN